MPTCNLRRDCGLTFWGFGVQEFGVYELVMHRPKELRSAEMKNENDCGPIILGFRGSGCRGLWIPDSQVE
jgi:hypothetical protein